MTYADNTSPPPPPPTDKEVEDWIIETAATMQQVKPVDNTQQKKPGGTQKKKPGKELPTEFLWRNHLKSDSSWAVELDESGAAIVMRWDDEKPYYRQCNLLDLQSAAEEWLQNMKKRYSWNGVKNCAAIVPSIAKNTFRRPRRPDRVVISVRNGVLDMQQDGRIRFRDHDRGEICTSYVDVRIPPDRVIDGWYQPKCQELIESEGLFSRLVMTLFPDEELRRCVQEYAGDTLSPVARKAFPFLLGPRNSGKSQFLRLLLNVNSNSAAADLEDLSNNFGIEHLLGKQLVVIDEFGKRIPAAVFKRLVGGAMVSVSRKFQTTLSVIPRWKFFGGCNDIFRVDDKSGAIEARIFVFRVSCPDPGDIIENLADKIAFGGVDGDGVRHEPQLLDVLDWLMIGASRVQRRGRLLRDGELPDSVMDVKRQVRADANPALAWLEESEAEPCGSTYYSAHRLYVEYCEWARSRGRYGSAPIAESLFLRDLLIPAMEQLHPLSELKQRRLSVTDPDSNMRPLAVKRANCYGIKFGNMPEFLPCKTFD